MPGMTAVVRLLPLRSLDHDGIAVLADFDAFRQRNLFLTIRDMRGSPYQMPAAKLAERFAADAATLSLGTGEHALRGGDDGQTEATEHLRELFLAAVNATARARDALDAMNDGLAVPGVLEIDAQAALRLPFLGGNDFVVADETLGLEDLGDLDLQLRARHLDAFVTRLNSVADSGQHIRDGICHRHSVTPD
jgi:hypothetical protein